MPAREDKAAFDALTDVSVPPYINEELIATSIADGLRVKNVRIVERTVTRAVPVGDNYMSDVFRIVVRFTGETDGCDRSIRRVAADGTQTVSLVVKSLPSAGKRGTIIEDLLAYEKEVAMFQDVVPKLSRMVKDTFFAARCYHATNQPERVIVFEDLKALGYVNSNRQAGFDFHQCALVMEKIGRFHAASMRLAEQEPELMRKQFNFNMFNPDSGKSMEDIEAIFGKGLEKLISVAKTQWEDFDPTIVAKLERLLPEYVERLRACLQQDVESDGGFRVLNHGDLWSNNILLRYDPNEPTTVQDVVFVDLQISFYTSPGIDLNYVLANCPNYETRSRLDELIDVYYRSFSATLRQLKYHTIPTMEQVRREIHRMEFFSLVSIVSVLPIVLMDKTDEVVADMESLMDGGEDGEKAREIQYNGVNYQRIEKGKGRMFAKHFSNNNWMQYFIM
uniref:CHK domain-containing protein n=1 Tax=Anopheles atroparvus TaxID=41427 RepID=A0A182ILS7_ANOAO